MGVRIHPAIRSRTRARACRTRNVPCDVPKRQRDIRPASLQNSRRVEKAPADDKKFHSNGTENLDLKWRQHSFLNRYLGTSASAQHVLSCILQYPFLARNGCTLELCVYACGGVKDISKRKKRKVNRRLELGIPHEAPFERVAFVFFPARSPKSNS